MTIFMLSIFYNYLTRIQISYTCNSFGLKHKYPAGVTFVLYIIPCVHRKWDYNFQHKGFYFHYNLEDLWDYVGLDVG